jgi:hypothetical protein
MMPFGRKGHRATHCAACGLTSWSFLISATMLLRKRFRKLKRNVIAFTTHKGGSMVLHRVLNDICHLNRIRYYSPNNEGEKLPFDRIFRGTDFISTRHGCFGPIRFFVPTKALKGSEHNCSSCAIRGSNQHQWLFLLLHAFRRLKRIRYPSERE